MNNPLALKLSSFVDLPATDTNLLNDLCADVRTHRARQDLIKEGDRPENVFLLIEGWACRYKVLRDGSRQIMAYLLPGDLCDVHIFFLKEMDHSIALLTDAKVAVLPKQKIIDLFDERPNLARALWWSTLVDEGVLREWIVNMGQRDAHDRIAHLIVELWTRLKLVGMTSDGGFELPITQADLGDTLGLTAVHVNRTLQNLRSEGLIDSSKGNLHIPDIQRLMKASDFDANYLHLSRRQN